MQNHVLLPSGLSTGSGPTYNSRRRLVTCHDALCDAEPTGVLLMLASEVAQTSEWLSGAYCDPHGGDRIKPAAEVERINERAIRTGQDVTLWDTGMPDNRWQFRPFNETEQAEIAKILAGELVETYMDKPGVFSWQPPTDEEVTPMPDVDRTADDQSAEKSVTPEPPQYHWWPGTMGAIESGFYVAVMGRPDLGYVYETSGGGWVATHAENYAKLSVPGFTSMDAAFSFLYYFAAPVAREV